jgi:Protein of unknown function (DUF1353)
MEQSNNPADTPDDALARDIAADVGQDVLEALNNLPTDQRMWAELSGAAEIASLIVSSISLVLSIWRVRQDRALLMLAIAAGLDRAADDELATTPLAAVRLNDEQRNMLLRRQTDPDQHLSILARVIEKLTPRQMWFEPTLKSYVQLSTTDREATERKPYWTSEWLRQLPGSAPASNSSSQMSQPVLMPFLEMDYWVTCSPISWTPPADLNGRLPGINVPVGFVTDLASIPETFWWAVTPTGKHGHAAILHDWLYWDQGPNVTRSIADRVFDVAMRDIGVDFTLRKILWAAVRVYGSEHWRKSAEAKKTGEKRILKTLPTTPVSWPQWRRKIDVFH